MNLSPESIALCSAGPFEADALVPFLPALVGEIAKHGESEVVQRCQIARANCATAGFAVECVKSYFDRPEETRVMSEMAKRAMAPQERAAAEDALSRRLLANMTAIPARVSVVSRPS